MLDLYMQAMQGLATIVDIPDLLHYSVGNLVPV